MFKHGEIDNFDNEKFDELYNLFETNVEEPKVNK